MEIRLAGSVSVWLSWHVELVEDDFAGRGLMPPFDTVDWDADRDWEWHTARDDTPEELFALFDDACRRADAVLDEAHRGGGVGLDGSQADGGLGRPRRGVIAVSSCNMSRHGTTAMPTWGSHRRDR